MLSPHLGAHHSVSFSLMENAHHSLLKSAALLTGPTPLTYYGSGARHSVCQGLWASSPGCSRQPILQVRKAELREMQRSSTVPGAVGAECRPPDLLFVYSFSLTPEHTSAFLGVESILSPVDPDVTVQVKCFVTTPHSAFTGLREKKSR